MTGRTTPGELRKLAQPILDSSEGVDEVSLYSLANALNDVADEIERLQKLSSDWEERWDAERKCKHASEIDVDRLCAENARWQTVVEAALNRLHLAAAVVEAAEHADTLATIDHPTRDALRERLAAYRASYPKE